MAGDLAKDILSELKPRKRLGERLMDRVGGRAWKRARVAISARIFKVYRLHDPWDPDSPADGIGNGLGPLSQRLAEDRRQPAPHAQPKEEKKPASPHVPPVKTGPAPAAEPPRPPPAQNRTPTVPPRNPSPPPASSKGADPDARPQLGYIPKTYQPKPGSGPPRPPPRAEPAAPTANPFGRPERPGLVGKLPMRPEAVAPTGPVAPTGHTLPVHPPRNSGGAGGRAEISRKPVAPAPPPPVARPGAGRSPGRVTLGAATRVVVEPRGELEITEIAPPPAPVAVSAAQATPPPPPEPVEAPPPPKPAPKPVNRAPPKGDGGLDDLFASSLDAGRLRMGRAKATAVATAVEPEEKPKRAPVALPKAALPPGLPKPKAEEPG